MIDDRSAAIPPRAAAPVLKSRRPRPLYSLAVDIRHQDDGGSGRDAGSDQGGAVPVYPASEPVDGLLLPEDNIDFYSIAL